MTKQELLDISKDIFGKKYDYRYIPSEFKCNDYVSFLYKDLIFKQKVSEHIKGKSPESTRVRNTQDFINKSKMLWGYNKYDYSLCEFKGSRKKIKIIYKSKIYEQWPINHLNGFKCENVWDTEKFITESKKLFKDKYDYSLVNFVNFHTPVKLILNGEIFEQKPDHHFRGNNAENSHKSKKLDNIKFIEKSRQIFGNRYDYSLVEYINARTNVKIVLGDVVYEQKPQNHLNGLHPEGINVVDTKTFITKSNQIHKNRYDYSLVEYKNKDEYVKILYKGVLYLQRPYYHLRGDRPEKKNFKKTTEEFICLSNLVHDFRYQYDKSKYTNAGHKVTITCPIHGDFIQSANSHLQGSGCSSCNESKGEKEIAKFLNKYDINYDRQHKFPDCKNIYTLPFDFYIPSMRTCIEFDGEQHFHPVRHFGGIMAYESLKINDKIKNDYCEDNYISLIRIRYDQIDDIYRILWDNLKTHIKTKKTS